MRWQALLRAFAALILPALLWAHDGVIQFRKQTAHLVVTLFSSPTPLRTGAAELSVLLQDADTGDPVLGADVSIQLTKRGATDITAAAIRGNATNQLLYATSINLAEPGVWSSRILIHIKGRQFTVTGPLTVIAQQTRLLLYWSYFAAVPIMIILFAFNRSLKARARRS